MGILPRQAEVIFPQTPVSVKEGLLKTILFVCSGNYCRSPLAEGLARLRLKQAGYDGQFITRSAGTLPDTKASRQPR